MPQPALATSAHGFKFQIPPLSEVLTSDLPPTEWVIPKRISVGDICILGGVPYSGKSWVLSELAIAWAAGLPAFNWAPEFSPQRIVLLDEENSKEEGWTRIRAITRAMGIDISKIQDTFLYPLPRSGFSFSKPLALQALVDLVTSFKPHWVFFDSLVGVLRLRNENDSSELRSIYNDCFKPLATSQGCGLLFLHHMRKKSTDMGVTTDYSDPEMLRGSGDIIAQADSILTMWRTGGSATIHCAKARRDPEHGVDPPYDLILSLEEINGGRRPILIEQRPPQGHASESLTTAILKAAASSSVPLPAQEVLARVQLDGLSSFSRSTFYATIKKLVDRKLITEIVDHSGRKCITAKK